jgi:YD repeat-containing protein
MRPRFISRVCVPLALLLLVTPVKAGTFTANLVATPNPNQGDFVLSYSDPSGPDDFYWVQEKLSGGIWTTIATNAASVSISSRPLGVHLYRIKWQKMNCIFRFGEEICIPSGTDYSEELSVTVEAAGGSGAPGDPGDPYTPPGPFTVPDDADFPDAAIVTPYVPTGDVGLNSVGALQGSGGVSGGQASYSIPIVVPPGRKGMQPSVSLNYSSSSGNGVVGVGWGLSATSSISRCSATAAQDGFTASVQYNAVRDRLCLDGQRLMVVSGAYGASGAEYRTELDGFARIKQVGSINGGTTYFTVEYKNNNKSWFGLTTDSKHKATGRPEIMIWAISRSQDYSKNTISYAYTDFANGEHQLNAIHYTGYNGSIGDRHVRFEYETRPDLRTYYSAGGKTRSTKRLKKVKTEYLSTLVREYTLSYGPSLSTSRSLLRSVEECAYKNGIKNCLPLTTFEWQESAPQYVTEQLQFHTGSSWEIKLANERWLHKVMPSGDDNGDGVKDWPTWSANAEGQITETFATNITNCFRKLGSFTPACLEVDFNADGLTDSFRRNNNKLEVKENLPDKGWISTGINWDSAGLAATADNPIGFADFNGDGWVDLAMKHDAKLWVYFHTQNVTAPFGSASRQLIHTYSPADASGTTHVFDIQIHGDMDGNGTPDFLLSFTKGGIAPGLPRPTSIYLTQSQVGGGLTITTRTISGFNPSIHVNAHFMHDVNGDGLVDLLRIDPASEVTAESGAVQYRLNNGVDFISGWTNLGMSLPMRSGDYVSVPGAETETYYEPEMSKVLVMDYDGDGRQEMLIAENVVVSSCTEIQPEGYKCDDNLYGSYQSNLHHAVGTPINSAINDDSIREYQAYQFTENMAGNLTTVSFASGIIGSASQTAVIDVTGDGLADVITVMGCRYTSCGWNSDSTQWGGTVTNSNYTEGAWINRNRGTATGSGRFEAIDMMSAVQDGFSIRNEWVYRPLSSDEYNTGNSDFYETTHNYQQNDYDYFHFASSMYVVAKHSASNGIGGLNDTLYRYRGAIYNNKGRGFQGFRAIEIEEDVYASNHSLASTDKISRTEFHQKWPTSSIVEKSCVWVTTDYVSANNPTCDNVAAANKLLSWSTTDAIHNVVTSGGARFVAAKNQTSRSYDLASRSLLTTKVATSTFDIAGNVTYQSSSHTDAWTTNFSETVSSYSPDWNGWWLNRVSSRAVKRYPVTQRHVYSPVVTPIQDQLKVATTTFSSYDTSHRLPSSIVVTANDSTLSQTVDTTYNLYGLPTRIDSSGTDVNGPRSVTTTFTKNGTSQSSDGYFPYTVENSLGHIGTVNTDPAHGQPTSQWDANGLQSTTVYDAFGRASETTLPGQPTVYQRYTWCDGSPWCFAGMIYSVQTISSAAPVNYAYFDSVGRERDRLTRNLTNSEWIRYRTAFDARGNTTFEMMPYDPTIGGSTTTGTHYAAYDALGRVGSKSSSQTNGQTLTTIYSYSGLTTTINAGGISMERTYNGLGQLVETKDGNGSYTRYSYDGAGNPVVIADPKMLEMPGNIGIKAAFNAFGHKEWVEDPDWWNDVLNTYGTKSFTYNALGEVLGEIDPNGNVFEMQYDVLGRLYQRKVNGVLDAKWYFDNTDTYKGLGLLDFEDSQFHADGSRLQKFYYYSAAASGRKDLLQVTHRFYENDDQNDFIDYATQYFTDAYYARPKGLRYPGGTSLAYEYNNAGYRIKEKDPTSAVIYREITALDAHGQITAANIGNHNGSYRYQVSANYFVETGQAKSMSVSNGGTNAQT